MNQEELKEAIIFGHKKAQKQYGRWTNEEYGLSAGAEYILTTYIAESIDNYCDNITLYVEHPIREIIAYSEDTIRKSKLERILDRDKAEDGHGRADIAIYVGDKPKCIIEIKNDKNRLYKKNSVDNDLDRILNLVQKGIIDYGIFFTNVEWYAKEDKIDEESDLEKFKKQIKNKLEKRVCAWKWEWCFYDEVPNNDNIDMAWNYGYMMVTIKK